MREAYCDELPRSIYTFDTRGLYFCVFVVEWDYIAYPSIPVLIISPKKTIRFHYYVSDDIYRWRCWNQIKFGSNFSAAAAGSQVLQLH